MTSHYRDPFNLGIRCFARLICSWHISLSLSSNIPVYTDCSCFEVKDAEDLLLEKTVRGYKTGRGKYRVSDYEPCESEK